MANFLINSAAVSVTGTEDKDTFQLTTGASAVTVQGLGADDDITLSGMSTLKDSVLLAGDGEDTFNLVGATSAGVGLSNVSVGGSLGKDSISFGLQDSAGSLNSVTVNGGQDADTIDGYFDVDTTASALSINGGQGDDFVNVFSGGAADLKTSLIAGGKGDDEISAGGISSVINTTINGGLGQDIIFLSAGTISATLINGGSNGVQDSESDSADEIFLNVSGQFNKSTVLGNGGDDVISANFSAGTGWSIGGGQGDDEIIFDGFAENATIGGGKGDDFITANNFEFSAASLIGGEGDDTINLGDTAGASTVTIEGGLGADTISTILGNSAGSVANFSYASLGDSTLSELDKVDLIATTAGDVVNNFAPVGIGVVADGTATVGTKSVTISAGYLDTFADSAGITQLTAAVEFLDAALTTDEAVAFKISAGATNAYLFVQGGDTDLLVEYQNVDNSANMTAASLVGKTNLEITFE